MSDKKIIIIAVILAVAVVIGGWLWSRQSPDGSQKDDRQGAKTTGIVIGNESAPVTIEEYTNFLCPACGLFARETLPQIEENYIKTGKVKFVFYVFPPLELSQAAFCSQSQGKFLDYHNYLFGHQPEIKGEEQVLEFAKNVGIDMEKFQRCYASSEAKSAGEAWLSDGQKRGVTATPTFFINNEKLVGAQPYSEFQKIIDSKLK